MRPGDSGNDDRLVLIHGRRADHAGDQPEVRRESVVESVHDVAQKSAGRRLVPGLPALSGDLAERGRVLRGFARECQCLRAAGCAARSLAMHVEVRLDLAPFFLEQHRQQKAGAEPAPECGQQFRASARTKFRRRMSVLGEQVGPDYDVPIFDVRQTRIDVFLLRVGLRRGEKAIEIRGVRFILPMVLEGVYVDLATLGRRLRGARASWTCLQYRRSGPFCTGNP